MPGPESGAQPSLVCVKVHSTQNCLRGWVGGEQWWKRCVCGCVLIYVCASLFRPLFPSPPKFFSFCLSLGNLLPSHPHSHYYASSSAGLRKDSVQGTQALNYSHLPFLDFPSPPYPIDLFLVAMGTPRAQAHMSPEIASIPPILPPHSDQLFTGVLCMGQKTRLESRTPWVSPMLVGLFGMGGSPSYLWGRVEIQMGV